jgi:hypothetical protein
MTDYNVVFHTKFVPLTWPRPGSNCDKYLSIIALRETLIGLAESKFIALSVLSAVAALGLHENVETTFPTARFRTGFFII